MNNSAQNENLASLGNQLWSVAGKSRFL